MRATVGSPLHPPKTAMSCQEATRSMLARCFQKYYALSDSAPTGILEGDVANPESPAPVLKHAVELGRC